MIMMMIMKCPSPTTIRFGWSRKICAFHRSLLEGRDPRRGNNDGVTTFQQAACCSFSNNPLIGKRRRLVEDDDFSITLGAFSSSFSSSDSSPISPARPGMVESGSSSSRTLAQHWRRRRTRCFHRSLTTTPSSSKQSTNNNNNSKNKKCPIYVSATRQHVGKTSTSLALVSGLRKRFDKVGFIKPVGQIALPVQDDDKDDDDDDDNNNKELLWIDKDVVLVKEHFGLDHLRYRDTSPILIRKGYTKRYLDENYSTNDDNNIAAAAAAGGGVCLTATQQQAAIQDAFDAVQAASDFCVAEGSGHVAVGSVIQASNAQVAAWLGAKMVLVVNGSIGNAIDELELNRIFCAHFDVDVAGVIVNKVQAAKYDQTRHYLSKFLRQRWGNVPLLGCIPDRPFLGCPALADLERILPGAQLVSGRRHALRHYAVPSSLSLVATSLQVFLRDIRRSNFSSNFGRILFVSHASRNDILLGFLMESQQRAAAGRPWEAALVVTGCAEHPISNQVMEIMITGKEDEAAVPPVLMVPDPTPVVMQAIHTYTPKLHAKDPHRVETTIQHYEPYIDFDLLLSRVGYNNNNNNDDSSPSNQKQQ